MIFVYIYLIIGILYNSHEIHKDVLSGYSYTLGELLFCYTLGLLVWIFPFMEDFFPSITRYVRKFLDKKVL